MVIHVHTFSHILTHHSLVHTQSDTHIFTHTLSYLYTLSLIYTFTLSPIHSHTLTLTPRLLYSFISPVAPTNIPLALVTFPHLQNSTREGTFVPSGSCCNSSNGNRVCHLGPSVYMWECSRYTRVPT